MPDWITHIGISFSGKYIKGWDLRLIAIGAVLPDIFKPLYIIFLDTFNIYSQEILTYFEPFHTPFFSLLFAIAISLLTQRFWFSLIQIIIPVAIHYILDNFQVQIGYYVLLLYPFSFKNLNIPILNWDSIIGIVIPLLILPFVLISIIKYKPQKVFVPNLFRNKRTIISFIIIIFLFIFPFFTRNKFYEHNYHSLQFYKDPTLYKGQIVYFPVSKVININPFMVEEMGRKFIIKTFYKY